MWSKRIIVVVILGVLFFSCKKRDEVTYSPYAVLAFSTDTVSFDTVFTTLGSLTLNFRFYNHNDKSVITDIQLGGGQNSMFRINVDGYMSPSVRQYEIRPFDSSYVFVEVTIDPQNLNTPVLIEDSIVFITNGNVQVVKLVAYGQNVHMLKGDVLKTVTWNNDKPYLILKSVTVDTLETLYIESGVRVYFHNNASLLVKGTLQAVGTKDNPILFQGDRFDEMYIDAPGQWGTVTTINGLNRRVGGITFFEGSTGNKIDYALIKNSSTGISIWGTGMQQAGYDLELTNTYIQYASLYGLEAMNSNVLAGNVIVANCGVNAIRLTEGGNYKFFHSTISNYYPSGYGSRKNSSVVLSNYNTKSKIEEPFSAVFGNCIIEGSLDDEIFINENENAQVVFDYSFDHCMIKISDAFDYSDRSKFINNVIVSTPDSIPYFEDVSALNFKIDTLSVAKNRGSVSNALLFPVDIQGISRTNYGLPDIGAFERVEGDTIP